MKRLSFLGFCGPPGAKTRRVSELKSQLWTYVFLKRFTFSWRSSNNFEPTLFPSKFSVLQFSIRVSSPPNRKEKEPVRQCELCGEQ